VTVLFDTSTLPARDRADAIRDTVAQTFVHAEINFAIESAAAAVGAITDLGQLTVLSMRSNHVSAERTPQLARDDLRPSIFFGLQLAGESLVAQGGRQAVVRPGELVIFDSTRPSVLTFRDGTGWPVRRLDEGQSRDAEIVLREAGNPGVHRPVDVIRTIDGDTFLARVHQSDGHALVARVRLRGIDAPEMKASCKQELEKAEAASDALRDLLSQGGVTIFNLGPEKYGRVLADVATNRTANVSAALLAGGFARSYNGGHRQGWCARSWRFWQ